MNNPPTHRETYADDRDVLRINLDKLQALEYLEGSFYLSPDDASLVISKLTSDFNDDKISLEAINTAIAENKILLKKIINSCLQKKHNSDEISDVTDELVNDVSNVIKEMSNIKINIEAIINSHHLISQLDEDIRLERDSEYYGMIIRSRSEAIRVISHYTEKLEVWSRLGQNPFAISDETMAEHFERRDEMASADGLNNDFLTTYFSSAKFGLRNRLMVAKIHGQAKVCGEEYHQTIAQYKHLILQILLNPTLFTESSYSRLSLRGVPENLIFTDNGTEAARLFANHCVNAGDRILVTDQEFGDILGILQRRGADIQDPLPRYTDDESYIAAIEGAIQNGVKYILVSDVSRLGTLFPLHIFSDIRDKYRGRVKLVVDACQALGRKVGRYDAIRPDAIIASCKKGAEVGESKGFLILEDYLLGLPNGCIQTHEDIKGTRDLPPFASPQFACIPPLLGTLGSGELESMTKSVADREKTLRILAYKFAVIIQKLNEKNGNRIKILNPECIYSGDGSIDVNRISSIFECKIEGVKRDQVQTVAQHFGVTIDNLDDETEKNASFRITFHPFMNDDAIKILAYVFMECCSDNLQNYIKS